MFNMVLRLLSFIAYTSLPRFKSSAVSFSEKERPYFVLSYHPAQLLDAEEWNKCHKNDQTIGEKFMGPNPQELDNISREPGPLPKAFDHILEYGEDSEKESENKRLIKGGKNQGLLFKAATDAEHFSDHDDFSKNQCLDRGHPVICVSDVIGGQKESSVLRKSGKKDGEIYNNYPVLDHLMDYFLL
ncbi:MAG: hypothetical protein V1844_15320 [Pseudomonadota bacterium]